MESTKTSLTQSLLLLLAVSTGVGVACIYLNQPLLSVLGHEFKIANDRIGLIATLTQLGYALGLLFLIPLGDIISKKRLIIIKQVLLALVLAASTFAANYLALLVASLFVGLFATVAQDFVPLSADLADEKKRGQTIGTIMTGLLLGILFSRTLAGIISDLAGWRFVFGLFAILNLLLAALGAAKIPDNVPPKTYSYLTVLKSLFDHFKDKPTLRYALVTQGCLGMAFSAFWTSLSFYLSGEPFHFSTTQIGLFGIAGAAGVLAAPIAGRMADKHSPYRGVTIGASLVAISFAGMLMAPQSLAVLIGMTLTFDLGLQMALVSHQAIIYGIDAKARASLNAIFMAGLFVFLALGSLISVRLQKYFGWQAILIFALFAGLSGLLIANFARVSAASPEATTS